MASAKLSKSHLRLINHISTSDGRFGIFIYSPSQSPHGHFGIILRFHPRQSTSVPIFELVYTSFWVVLQGYQEKTKPTALWGVCPSKARRPI